jgi:L-threonylcarbamoyladenylate synthase
VAEEVQIEKHFEHVPDAVWDLFEHNDRPTTVVMPKGKGVDESILAEDGSLGVRLVRDPWMEFVAHGLGHPIASTSANISGSPTPSNFDAIDSKIIEGADFVSAHRRSDRTVNTSSFIVSFDTSERFKILRD